MAASVRGAGIGIAVVSAAAFGTSGAFAGSLLEAGWTPGAAVTARVVVAAVVLTLPALRQLRRSPLSLHRGARTFTLYGLVAVAGAQLCYFNAVQTLSVAVALLIEYAGVLLVVLWLWVREGQRPRPLTIVGAVVAVSGLGLVLDLLGSTTPDPAGVLWALGAAVGLATYFVVSAGTDEAPPPLVIAWGGLAVGGVALLGAASVGVLPVRAPRVDVQMLGTSTSWLVPVLGLSLLAAVVAYVTGITAARLLGATLASFLGLTEVLFAVLFAWLLLGQVLTAGQLVGGVLVVAGVGVVRLDELRRTRSPAAAPARQVVLSGGPAAAGSRHEQAPHAVGREDRLPVRS